MNATVTSTTWARVGRLKDSNKPKQNKPKQVEGTEQQVPVNDKWAPNFEQTWKLYDAEGVILGRLASQIAQELMGKLKPIYTPHIDTGDYIVVINAEKIMVTGNNKLADKKYYWHTGYMGGIKERALSQMIDKKPEDVITLAVERMLPKTKLGRKMIKKLKVHAGSEHPHEAQQPVKVSF